MIASIKILEKYCKDYTKIENYEEAVKSPLKYDLHHRREFSESKSRKQLIAENLYYGRPPEELIFLEHGEHQRLHRKGKFVSTDTRKKMSDAKKNMSEETRKKISNASKGRMKGKHWHLSAETKQKMSEAKKGKRWHLENGKHVWTE
mgnify:CR=1 FL=1